MAIHAQAPTPAPLLILERDRLIDSTFYGFVAHYNTAGELLNSAGDAGDCQFFLRSLAKPLQASLLCDFKTDEFFDFKAEEIAIFSASHTAQEYHLGILKSIFKKIGLEKSYENVLKCGVHNPFEQRKDGINTQIHNNCSGKHALMLALCIQNAWGIENYLEYEHPLQKYIFEKISLISGYKKCHKSLDGCGAPIYALPLKNISKAFFNVFESCEKIRQSFLSYPEIIGGKNRLDTKIIQKGAGKLVAKVGAGGFLAVVNLTLRETLVIKLCQDNNAQREIIASIFLNRINWLKEPLCEYTSKNLHGNTVGKFVPLF